MSFNGEPLFLEDLDDDHLENDDYEEEVPWHQYMIDDTLDFLSKFDRYHTSDIPSQRLVLLQSLGENLPELETRALMEKVLPIFTKFAVDAVPALRREYLIQMKLLAFHFLNSEREDSKLEVFQNIIPACFDLTIDDNAEVSSCAMETIVEIASALQDAEVEDSICQFVNLYSHDDRDEECRVVAIRIYSLLASRFNPYRLSLVVCELTNHAEDMSSYVRSTVARNVHKVMVALGSEQAYGRLYPVFQALSRDEMPEVRASCAENFVEVVRLIGPEMHWEEICEEASRLFLDDHESVHHSMLRIMGDYISLLPEELISADTLLRYAEIPKNEATHFLSESCAQAFLGVLKSVGVQRWEELSLCFSMLIQHNEIGARQIIVENLAGITDLFDSTSAHKVFLPVFQYLLESEDVVKIEMAMRTHDLLKNFPATAREECIIMLSEKLKGTDNWRVRKAVGDGLCKLLHFCGAVFIKNIIVNIALTMLGDSVSVVRQTGTTLVASCIEFLKQVEYEIDYIIDQVCCFAESGHYAQRLLFVVTVEKIYQFSPSIIHDYFITKLTQLADDSVSNIRIRVAKFLNKIDRHHREAFASLLERMKLDIDEEVRWCAHGDSFQSENTLDNAS